MTRILHPLAAVLSTLLGIFVGGWAYLAPDSFYSSFPGVLGHWIDIDGPYNEHLIRDVGAMYLALAASGVVALAARSTIGFRVLGAAWTLFGALHFAYHVTHLDHGTTADAVGTVVTLAISLLLGVALVLPARSRPAVGKSPAPR